MIDEEKIRKAAVIRFTLEQEIKKDGKFDALEIVKDKDADYFTPLAPIQNYTEMQKYINDLKREIYSHL